jgi:hypothetical protein
MMSAHEMDAMAADAKTRAILAREHTRADRAVSASPDRIRQRPRRREAGGKLIFGSASRPRQDCCPIRLTGDRFAPCEPREPALRRAAHASLVPK